MEQICQQLQALQAQIAQIAAQAPPPPNDIDIEADSAIGEDEIGWELILGKGTRQATTDQAAQLCAMVGQPPPLDRIKSIMAT